MQKPILLNNNTCLAFFIIMFLTFYFVFKNRLEQKYTYSRLHGCGIQTVIYSCQINCCLHQYNIKILLKMKIIIIIVMIVLKTFSKEGNV